MKFYPLLLVHMFAGSVGFLSGAAALFFRKGARGHRLAGNTFSVSILIMSASGAYIAAFIRPLAINVIAGVLTFYLVATSWLTVLRKEGETGMVEYGLLVLALVDGVACLLWMVVSAPRPWVVVSFIFGAVALLGAATDAHMLSRHGVVGAQRLRRHVWRMGLAMFIVTMSLFIGTPKRVLVPSPIRDSAIAYVPVLTVAAIVVFWLWRLRERHTGGGEQPRSSPPYTHLSRLRLSR